MKHAPILLLPVFLLLNGCLAFPFSPSAPESPEPAAQPEQTPVSMFIAGSDAGTTGEVDDASFGGTVDVAVESVFTSAGGRTCKRAIVSRPPHEAEVVILCKNDDSWMMMPRVWGRGLD